MAGWRPAKLARIAFLSTSTANQWSHEMKQTFSGQDVVLQNIETDGTKSPAKTLDKEGLPRARRTRLFSSISGLTQLRQSSKSAHKLIELLRKICKIDHISYWKNTRGQIFILNEPYSPPPIDAKALLNAINDMAKKTITFFIILNFRFVKCLL